MNSGSWDDIILLVNLVNEEAEENGIGTKIVEKRYRARVNLIISDKNICNYLEGDNKYEQ